MNKAAESRSKKTASKIVPIWLTEDNAIDETKYCDAYRNMHKLQCISGRFYNATGIVTDDWIKHSIQADISPYKTRNIAGHTKNLFEALKISCYAEQPLPSQNVIHVLNGEIDFANQKNLKFSPTIRFCLNRINVRYNSSATSPDLWLKFLNDLLNPDDLLTLQEYLGYCLIPTTKAQKMLMIVGKGGEGKSVVGAIVKEILGSQNVFSGKLAKLEENQLAVANLENKLLFIDDDLRTAAASESAVVKEIVTCNGEMEMERKGAQSYQGEMYCRLMAFGNQDYKTMHDQSDGAFRRRIILSAKPKSEDRKDDRDLIIKLVKEKESIFLWMLDGLVRLIAQDYNFTISKQTQENLERSKRDSFNFLAYLDDADQIQLGDPAKKEHCADIYAHYCDWCRANAETPCAQKTVTHYLQTNADKLNIRYDYHVIKHGARARGFSGVELLEPCLDEPDDTDCLSAKDDLPF